MPNNQLIIHPSRSGGNSNTVLYLEPMGSASSEADNPLSAQIWRVLRLRFHWVLAAVVVGCLLGFIVSLRETPIYEARVSLEIQNPAEMSPSLKVGDEASDSPESSLPTPAAILRRRTLHRLTIDRLKKEKFQSQFQPGSRMGTLRRLLGLAPPVPPRPTPVSVDIQLSVNTRIATIIGTSSDPQFAAAFTNALVNEYIDSNLRARWDAINNARQWLAQQLEETRAKLRESETNLQDYSASSHLLFTGDKESTEQSKLKEMQAALFDAQAERISKQSQYQIATSTPADSVPQVLDNVRLG